MFKLIKKIWLRIFHNVEKALKNSIIDGEIIIGKSKEKLKTINDSLINLQTQTLTMEKTIEREKEKIEQFDRMAKRAIEKNDEHNARMILQKKYYSDYKIKAMEEEINKNKIIESKLENEIDLIHTKILKAEFELSRFKIQIDSNTARSSIIKDDFDISSDSINSIMDDIRNLNIKTESECEVLERKKNKTVSGIEEKDFMDSMKESIEEELKKLKS